MRTENSLNTDDIIKVADTLAPAMPGSVRLNGWLGGRIAALIKNSVMAQDRERLVRPFREKTEVGDDDWRCEYWGKWATSAALASAYAPTPDYLAMLNKAARELLATQDPDGYIGTRKPEHHLAGWDVWGRKYVLLGLLGIYNVTGDKGILDAARRHADSLMAECGPGKANIAAIGYPMWKGLPPTSVLEPVVLLYELTGAKKYLEFAEYIVGQWSKPNHWSPNGLRLVENALAGKPVGQEGDAPKKAYEMMSCYEGLCELFRVTGEQKYREASVKLAASIFNDELTIIGSGSDHEGWCGGRHKQCGGEALLMETCVAATWMKFCFQLLRLTGDARYADALETCLYNALLGSLAPAGHWWGYMTSLSGDRVPSHQQHDDVGASCCVLNGPRALLLTPRWAVMTDAAGPVVNLYNRGTAEVCLRSGNRVHLAQDTDYPASDLVVLQVRPERSETFTLSLRIPAWSARNSLRLNGTSLPVEAQPGTYARIRRKWADGDMVELKLDLRGRVVVAPGGKNFVAVTRGPIVLALDSRLCPTTPTTALEIACDDDAGVLLTPNPRAAEKAGLWLAFDAVFTDGAGDRRTLTLCDFASAGNAWDEESQYSVWLARPLDLAAVWQNGPSRFWQKFRTTRPEMPPPPA